MHVSVPFNFACVWISIRVRYSSAVFPMPHVQILKHTPADHADYGNLEDALQRAEELCNQVNEGVREKENSDRLEWIQRHVHCDGLAEVSVSTTSKDNEYLPAPLFMILNLHC